MRNRTLNFATGALTVALSLNAMNALALQPAYDCTTDEDCGDGGQCEKDVSTSGCAAGPDGTEQDCDSVVQTSERGFCVVPPEICESDADCGEYLTCNEENLGSCSITPEGETSCTEQRSLSYCGAGEVQCESDGDCPRDFECAALDSDCAAIDIDCPEENPDCNTCLPSDQSSCQPRRIECQDDTSCPADWSCVGTVFYECTGSGDIGEPPPQGGGGQDEPAPIEDVGDSGSAPEMRPAAPSPLPVDPEDTDDAIEPPIEDGCVQRAQTGICYPGVWVDAGADGIGSDSTGENDSADSGSSGVPKSSDMDSEEAGKSLSDDDDSGGAGCSVSPGRSSFGAWFLALLFFVPSLRRARRSSGS